MENFDKNNPFNYHYEPIENVELVVNKHNAKYAVDRCRTSNYKHDFNKDGSLNIYIKTASKWDLFCWILCEGSNVKVIKPLSLIIDVKKHCQELIKLY